MKRAFQAVAALVLGVSLSLPVLAHTRLEQSSPADQSVLTEAPDQIELVFSEAVTLTAVTLRDAGGAETLDAGAREPAEMFSVSLPALAAGSYRIEWRAVSADTHVITGEIEFTVET